MDIGLASLLSSLGNALFGTGATIAQNQYNSPVSQLRRLRKAGLPQAYMYQGKVNQQTSVPQLSLEPTLGQAKKLELSQQNEINQANIKQIAEKIIEIQKDVELKEEERKKRLIDNERNSRRLSWEKRVTSYKDPESGKLYMDFNDFQMMDLEKQSKKFQNFIDQNEGRLRKVMADVEDDLFGENVQADTKRKALERLGQQITYMAAQTGLLKQMKDMREFQAELNKTMAENMESKGELVQTIMWFIMQFTGKFNF